MKKKFLALMLIFALSMTMLVACNNDDKKDDDAKEDSVVTDLAEGLKDSASGNAEEEDTYPYTFHFAYATDETLKDYANYTECSATNDKDAVKILITADEELSNIKIFSVEFLDFNSDGKANFNFKDVTTAANITPDCPLVLTVTFGEVFPNFGFSFTDSTGDHKIGIEISGINNNPIPTNLDK